MSDEHPETGGAAALLTVTSPSGPPTLHEAARLLELPVSDLDPDFGVVAIDASRDLFAVRTKAGGEAAPGAFSDPKIESFGP